MAKVSRFSNLNLRFDAVAEQHGILQKSLRDFFIKHTDVRFVGYTLDELKKEQDERLSELDKASSLTILASIEASLRIDYLQRCEDRRKDSVSIRMREIYKNKADRAKIEDDILEVWKQEAALKAIAERAKAAFKYRHWLAHGRYLVPKLGRSYDFEYLVALASEITSRFCL